MPEMIPIYITIAAKFVAVSSIIIVLSALIVLSFALVSFLVNLVTNVYTNRIWKRLKSTQDIRQAVRVLNRFHRSGIRLTERDVDELEAHVLFKRKQHEEI